MSSDDNNDENLSSLISSKKEFSKKCRRISIKNIASGVVNQVNLYFLFVFYQ